MCVYWITSPKTSVNERNRLFRRRAGGGDKGTRRRPRTRRKKQINDCGPVASTGALLVFRGRAWGCARRTTSLIIHLRQPLRGVVGGVKSRVGAGKPRDENKWPREKKKRNRRRREYYYCVSRCKTCTYIRVTSLAERLKRHHRARNRPLEQKKSDFN